MSAATMQSATISSGTPVDPMAPVWWVAVMGGQYGPYRQVDLVQMMRAHQVDGETLAWHDGMDTWTPLRSISVLSAELPDDLKDKVPEGKASIPPQGHGWVGMVVRFVASAVRMDEQLADIHDCVRSAWIIAGMAALCLLFYFSVWAGWPAGIAHGAVTTVLALLALWGGVYGAARHCIRGRVEWRFVWTGVGLALVPLIPTALFGGLLGLLTPLALWLLAPGLVMSGLVLMQYFVRAHKALPVRASRGALLALSCMVLLIALMQAYVLGGSTAAQRGSAPSDGSEPMPVDTEGRIELGGAVSAPTAPPSFEGGGGGGGIE